MIWFCYYQCATFYIGLLSFSLQGGAGEKGEQGASGAPGFQVWIHPLIYIHKQFRANSLLVLLYALVENQCIVLPPFRPKLCLLVAIHTQKKGVPQLYFLGSSVCMNGTVEFVGPDAAAWYFQGLPGPAGSAGEAGKSGDRVSNAQTHTKF